MGNIWIGIDTGGTFTDLVLVDQETGEYCYHKLPTTTSDPSKAILEGVDEIIRLARRRPEEVAFLVLGTTLATNAVLEGKTAPTGMLTTRGFRDVLELARQRRPHYFNLDILKPEPPVKRDCRIEVGGRIDHDGSVSTPLSEDDVRAAANILRDKGVQAVAICFMHSYANPEHEEQAKAMVQKMLPGVYLCTSSEVLAEFREYERFATTAVNASLMPIMDRYLERFVQGVKNLGINRIPRVMQSNGGAVSPAAVRRMPVNTFFSGPAGGVIGTVGLGRQLGIDNMITFDMGGTSTDVCLIKKGEPAKKNERQMGGFPVRTRTLDIHTIGAGGGSLAWIDAGGLLKVGPQSAGAYPGPAAYGRGGTRPTVTDANVVLGRLNPRQLLGGRMKMYPENAQKAFEDELGEHLSGDSVKAAAGILEIVNVNMIGALRVISVEQGEDPRDFTLVAFGGAGPLHAADVARTIGMRRVLVPPRPGLLCALGQLHADVRGDFSLTRMLPTTPDSLPTLNTSVKELRTQGERWLSGETEQREDAHFEWLVDLRYVGQNGELILPLPQERLTTADLDQLTAAFHQRHELLYGYKMDEHAVEIVTLRLVVRAKRPTPPAEHAQLEGSDIEKAIVEHRDVWFPETGFVGTPVYDRERLPIGCTFSGPAIVEQMDTTTVVPPGAKVSHDKYGYLMIEMEPAAAGKAK
ncbi:hydantoinase/oxoprolinase family protein [Noviherbaspirillum sp.]|uniref:hydantoinase/oxoprolinase family protein n=1 Tax=Noviherbaspirillum sp. TaxID=1926288 RepID=UPI002B49E3D5|nr:hydantoinase/oxoprolinase family protein [Noviherbaspirillum sp.]HJV82394.1 hydantoinase/oxoprolinase family protein [Noviherbaspirillum sp.]